MRDKLYRRSARSGCDTIYRLRLSPRLWPRLKPKSKPRPKPRLWPRLRLRPKRKLLIGRVNF
jgi:hypothetical protein